MNKDYTVEELAKVLTEEARAKFDNDLMYAHLYGTMIGLLEAARWGYKPVQQIINERVLDAQKELALA